MPTDTLHLGTIFDGKIDPSLTDAIREIKELVVSINSALASIKGSSVANLKSVAQALKTVSKASSESGTELSDFAKVMGRASDEYAKFRGELNASVGAHGREGTALRSNVKDFYRAEQAIMATARTMTRAGAAGKTWAESVSRVRLLHAEAAGEIKLAADGITFFSRDAARAADVSGKLASSLGLVKANATDFDKVMSKNSGRSNEFKRSLQTLADSTSKSGREFQIYARKLETLDDTLIRMKNQMNAAGKAGETFYRSANRLGLVAQEAVGRIRILPDTIKAVTTAAQATVAPLTATEKELKLASGESRSYQIELAKLLKTYGTSSIVFREGKRQLQEMERAVQRTRIAMNRAGADGDSWARSVDRGAIASQKLTGNVKFTKDGIVTMTSAARAALGITDNLASNMGLMGDAVARVAPGLHSVGSSLTTYQKAMGNASTYAANFQKALIGSTDAIGKSEAAVRLSESQMRKLADSAYKTGLRLSETGVNGELFAQSINASGLQAQLLNGQLKLTSSGLQWVSKSAAEAAGVAGDFAEKYGMVARKTVGISGSLLEFKKAMQGTAGFSREARVELAQLGKQFGVNSIVYREAALQHSALASAVDKTAVTFQRAGRNGDIFKNSLNTVALRSQMLEGSLKIVGGSLQWVSEGAAEAAGVVGSVAKNMRLIESPAVAVSSSLRALHGETLKYADGAVKFRTELFKLGQQLGVNSQAYQTSKQQLISAERAIWKTAETMRQAGKDGDAWARAVDRSAIVSQKLAGNITYTTSGIQMYTTEAGKALGVSTSLAEEIGMMSKTAAASAGASAPLVKELEGMGKYSDWAKGKVKEFGESLGLNNSKFEYMKRMVKETDDAIVRHAESLKAAGKDGDAWAASVDRNALLQGRLAGQLKFTKAGIVQMGEATRHAASLNERFAVGVSKLASSFGTIASYAAAGAFFYAFTSAVSGAISAIFEFDQSIKNLQAITKATDGEVSAMGDAISEVAATTRYSVQEVSDGMILLGQAGFTAGEALDSINAVAMLSTGTMTDLKTSSDLLTTTIRAFGLEAREAGRVADVFAVAVNRSKLTVEKLRIAFNYVGPIARLAGMELEEVVAVMMELANAGVRASTIGTGLRQVLGRLVSPTKKIREAFISAGLSMDSVNPKLHSMREIIQRLSGVITDAGTAFELFGLRGAPAIAVLIEQGITGFDRMYKAIAEGTGAATAMAEKQMEGLSNISKNLLDKLSLLGIALGEGGLSSAFRVFYSVIGDVVQALTWLASTPIGKITVAITGMLVVVTVLTAGIAGLTIALSAFSTGATISATSAMVKEFGLLSVALAGAKAALATMLTFLSANPYIALLTAIMATVAGIGALSSAFSEANQRFEKNAAVFGASADSLERYNEKLSALTVGSTEYDNMVSRIVHSFPQLRENFSDTTKTVEEQATAVGDLTEKMQELQKENLIKALDNQKGQMKQLKDEARALSLSLKQSGLSASEFAEYFNLVLVKGTPSGFFKQLGIGAAQFAASLGLVENPAKNVNKSIVLLEDKMKDLKVVSAVTAAKLRELGEDVDLSELGLSVEEVDGSLQDMKSSAEALEAAWDIMSDNAKLEEQRKMVRALGLEWEDLYDSLDDLDKADLAVTAQGMDKKIDSIQKAGEAAFLTQTQIDEQINEEKAKALDQFLKNVKSASAQEIKEAEKTAKEKLKIYKSFLTEYERLVSKSIDVAGKPFEGDLSKVQKQYDTELTLIKRNADQKVRILEMSGASVDRVARERFRLDEESYRESIRLAEAAASEKERIAKEEALTREGIANTYYDALVAEYNRAPELHEDLASKIVDVEKKRADKIVEIERKSIEQRKEAYSTLLSFYQNLSSSIIAEQEKLAQKIAETSQRIVNIETERQSTLRDLSRQDMSAVQKVADSSKAYAEALAKSNSALSQGNYKEAEDWAKEASAIAKQYYSDVITAMKEYTKTQEKMRETEAKLRSEKAEKKPEAADVKKYEDELQALQKVADQYKTMTDTKEGAIAKYNEAMELRKTTAKASLDAYKNEFDTLETTLGRIKTKVEEYKQLVQDISTQAIKLDTESVQKQLDALKASISDMDLSVIVEFKGKGSSETYISEKIAEVQGLIDSLRTYVAQGIDVTMSFGTSEQSITDAVTRIKSELDSLRDDYNELKAHIEMTADISPATKELEKLKKIIDVLIAGPLQVLIQLAIEGMEGLLQLKKIYDELINKTVNITVNTIYTSSGAAPSEAAPSESDRYGGEVGRYRTGGKVQGFASGGGTSLYDGAVPGYGGGDKRNILVEDGEYVIKKESVKGLGVRFFDFWNKFGGNLSRFSTLAAMALIRMLRARARTSIGMVASYGKSAFATGGLVSGSNVRESLLPSIIEALSGSKSVSNIMRSEESSTVSKSHMIVHFRLDDKEYPVVVQDKDSQNMIKEFSDRLEKMRLVRAI